MSVGSVIKESRVRKSLKQTTVAAEVGVTVQTYIKWESDETEPKASQIAKLSEVLDVSSNSICKGVADKKYELTQFMRYFSKLSDKASDFEMGISIWEIVESDEAFIANMRKNAGLHFNYEFTDYNEQGDIIYLTSNDRGDLVEVKDPLWD